MKRKVALTALLIFALVGSLVAGLSAVEVARAESRTIVVPTNYPTIQQAINAANYGDTVFVKRGIYNETLVVNKTISLIGEDRENTIIDAQKAKRQVILVYGDSITIANFTLGNNEFGPPTWKYWSPSNGEGDGISIGVISNYISIVNNTIINCIHAGIAAGFSRQNLIAGNIVINSSRGILVTCVESTIVNNTFANTSKGIEFTTYEVRGGYVDGERRWILNETNTIQGNEDITLTTFPSPFPTYLPSPSPTPSPTATPTTLPTPSPILTVTLSPTSTPTQQPTLIPTLTASSTQSIEIGHGNDDLTFKIISALIGIIAIVIVVVIGVIVYFKNAKK